MPCFNLFKKLTTSQFETIVKRRKCYGELRLNFRNLSDVDPQILAKSILDKTFHNVALKETNLTKTQLETILTQIALIPQGRPMRLDLSQNDMSDVHPKILSRAVIKIGQINVRDCFLSMETAEVLFKEIVEAQDPLLSYQYLVISSHLCRGKVNTELAKAVVNKIEKLETAEARCRQMNNIFNGRARAAVGFLLKERQDDIELEEQEFFKRTSDQRDYVVDEDDDASVKADKERSQSNYLKMYYSLLRRS